MEHQLEIFQNAVLGVILALFISSILFLLAKKIKFIPYTVLLVAVGIFVQPGNFPPFDAIRLNPGMVLYIILPILLFESAFNFDYREFKKVLSPAFLFATVGLIISALILATGLHLLFKMDFQIALMFGAVISSTDPIAVLSIFKELGVPKKLQLIVDAESFLNDGTSVIMFKILSGFVLGTASIGVGNETLLATGFGNFLYVFFGGAVVGLIMGWLFAQLLSSIKNVSSVEITLTLILATSVFIIAEHYLAVSGILAVLVAGLVLGNYGRHKISPQIATEMHQTWNMLVFISTSIVFLLIGYEIHIFTFFDNFGIIIATIAILLLARTVSVYLLSFIYNLKAKVKIPTSWTHIINIGGLRGSLPLVIILLLPHEFASRELLIDLTLGVILFSLLFNATFINLLISKLKIVSLTKVNVLEMKIVEILIYKRMMNKLEELKVCEEVRDHIYQKHKINLLKNIKEAQKELEDYLKEENGTNYTFEINKILDRYCINLEKSLYFKLYKKNIINEGVFIKLNSSIQDQLEIINLNGKIFNPKIKNDVSSTNELDRIFSDRLSLSSIVESIRGKRLSDQIRSYYIYHKARILGDQIVINELNQINKQGYTIFSDKIISDKTAQYKELLEYNQNTLKHIEGIFPDLADSAEDILYECESDELISSLVKQFGEEERVSAAALKNLDLKI